jgi:hypothetical protein
MTTSIGRGVNFRSVSQKSLPSPISSDYVYLVPFDEVGDVIILRTIIPSRKATRQYLEEKKRRS